MQPCRRNSVRALCRKFLLKQAASDPRKGWTRLEDDSAVQLRAYTCARLPCKQHDSLIACRNLGNPANHLTSQG
jgi:hypothetical protein